jgi:hypothetical protein
MALGANRRGMTDWRVAAAMFALAASVVQQRAGEGPWNNDLLVGRWDRGGPVRWAPWLERGGVATLARDPWQRLIAAFQWFPAERRDAFDRIAVRFSYDDGTTWGRPQTIEVRGLPPRFMRPCDPTLVALDDGRYRLYFTSGEPDRHAATYSAISTDAVRYTFEPGRRVGIEGESVLDCAVAQLAGTWHYFAPAQRGLGRGYHAVSHDGLNFQRVDDVVVPGDRQWLGCATSSRGGLRFFGSGRDGIWSAFSRDGVDWQLEDVPWGHAADPGVAETADGGYLIVATGPRRADAGRGLRLPDDRARLLPAPGQPRTVGDGTDLP